MYSNIIVDISHEKVDRHFQYRVPVKLEGCLEVGMEVIVPFGKGNKPIHGYVIQFTETPDWEEDKIKDILQIVPGRVMAEQNMIRLAAWMRDTYGSTMISALKTVLPVKKVIQAVVQKQVEATQDSNVLISTAAICEKKHYYAQQRLLLALAENAILPMELITDKLHVTTSTIKALEKQELLRVTQETQLRNPIAESDKIQNSVVLSDEQATIINEIRKDYDNNMQGVYLIHGITGSGKTQVYMELIEDVIRRGQQAIVLIPEISLTYQTVIRFYQKFGSRVTIMNSRLSDGEKYDQMVRVREKKVDIMIGPRSALFTPFENLGIIIIDEEHEGSYKSDSMPKYHAREVAIQLAKMHHAGVVLGSATPSVESYDRALHGEYRLFTMTKRLTGQSLPMVYTVDLREELKAKNKSIFSRKLAEMIEERLLKREQIILFLNRRGYAGFVSCRTCGKVIKCPHCDVSLSEHKNGKMVCHYCGYEQSSVKKCPECGSPYVAGFKVGTQQIEEMIHTKFPLASVLRMDADTTKTKDSYEKILSAFENHDADILLGTQMIVKGHDFPGVTLVGILAADLSLGVGDYRAAERTFQLLTQAAGRAGRGDLPGEVVIQTYQPEHYAVTYAAMQDYVGFYREEIVYRNMMMYPPAAHMLAILIQSKYESECETMAQDVLRMIQKSAVSPKNVIGPAPASIAKLNDRFRRIIYMKDTNLETLKMIKNALETEMTASEWAQNCVQFDLDPMDAF